MMLLIVLGTRHLFPNILQKVMMTKMDQTLFMVTYVVVKIAATLHTTAVHVK